MSSCRRISLFIIFVLCCAFFIHNGGSVEVTVEQGKLEGLEFPSRNGTKYYGFLGIPFAKPPVGELRFEPPQPAEPWQGVRNATKRSNDCIQMDLLTIRAKNKIVSGKEDCLYLNVFTPAERTGSLPVMVFIHGGAFLQGNAYMYGPAYFMDHPVVMVTIQYRLGILGFMSTGDSVLPGNNGMKDQVAALKWVKKNIHNFGGDPNRITIFGESAGGASVHLHMYSHLSTGLFQRAISQSGNGLAFWVITPRSIARERALVVGVLNGCSTKDSKRLVDCLRGVPAKEILLSQPKFGIWKMEPVISFGVVLEAKNIDGAFLTANPWLDEAVSSVPWLAGFNTGDGGIFSMKYLDDKCKLANDLNAVYKRIFPIVFYYGFWLEDENKITAITEALKTFYFKDKPIGSETANTLIEIFNDGSFKFYGMEAAHRHKAPVYFYYYEHRNNQTFKTFFGSSNLDLGSFHADDLLSLFNIQFFPKGVDGADLVVSKRMVNYWVNFASTGNPNSGGQLWTAITQPNDLDYLHIDTEQDTMRNNLLKEAYSLWKGFEMEKYLKAE